MFRDDYAAELDELYQTAAELAQAHPRIAPMLGRDADPGVTRLFQSAAFLFARLRERLDDDLPEVIHPVIESVFPALLRPLPCTTIVELAPDDTVKEPIVAARGSLFSSGDVEGAPCVFQSMDDVDVRPWALERVELASEGRELRLRIALLGGANLSGLSAGSSLRVFLAGASALDVRSMLLRHTREAIVRPAGREGSAISLGYGGQALLRSVAAPRPGGPTEPGPPAFDALRSYFAWPAHFAFVELPNIDRALPIATADGAFEIAIRLGDPFPKGVRLGLENVRLHCVPAMNAYALSKIHFPIEGRRCALPLPHPTMQVYTVRSVSLVRADLAARTAIPYSDFATGAAEDDEPAIFFSVDRLPSVVGTDPIVALSFETDADLAPFVNANVALDVTDGVRAERVGLGELCQSTAGSPSGLTFRNVLAVTRAAAPAFDADRLWRWLALLKATLPQLTHASHLASCIALANHPAWAQWPDVKPSAVMFEGLRAVRLGPAAGRDDAVVPIVVDVDPDAFAGSGDMDLFGERLAEIFASTQRPYESVALVLRDAEARVLFEYPPVPGTKEGL
jgi:type VI secretion system protein ImpG